MVDLARRQRKSGKGFFMALVYLFSIFGFLLALLGAYQFEKISALFSVADVLSASDKAIIIMDADSEKLQRMSLSVKDANDRLVKSFDELGINADVKVQ